MNRTSWAYKYAGPIVVEIASSLLPGGGGKAGLKALTRLAKTKPWRTVIRTITRGPPTTSPRQLPAAPIRKEIELGGDFRDKMAAMRHYSKHAKGLIQGSNGKVTAKGGGADMPEFKTFGSYHDAAREFMGGAVRPGTFEKTRGPDIIRVDPTSGYFGIRSSEGVIRTFFNPDGNSVDYFNRQVDNP
ncbi:hypothetical protein [Acidipropionibacterium acidipropionici]|uniref:hypothetical protein n=1 Tax=Acidipropionibacterium acidipropionici TaxID=1748 RepID=UPI000F7DA72B|nr:hypothetical protein [Acidipropionibacterium acidipropionici]